jgi:hypothetical protein
MARSAIVIGRVAWLTSSFRVIDIIGGRGLLLSTAKRGCRVLLSARASLIRMLVRRSRGLSGRRLLPPVENGLELLFDLFHRVDGFASRRGQVDVGAM